MVGTRVGLCPPGTCLQMYSLHTASAATKEVGMESVGFRQPKSHSELVTQTPVCSAVLPAGQSHPASYFHPRHPLSLVRLKASVEATGSVEPVLLKH